MYADAPSEHEDPRLTGRAGALLHLRVAGHARPRDRDDAALMRQLSEENLPHARRSLALSVVSLAAGPLIDSTGWWIAFSAITILAAWMTLAYLRAVRR